MGERQDKGGYVERNNPVAGTTEQWPKDSAGCTNEDTKQTTHHNSGNVTDSTGRIVGNVRK